MEGQLMNIEHFCILETIVHPSAPQICVARHSWKSSRIAKDGPERLSYLRSVQCGMAAPGGETSGWFFPCFHFLFYWTLVWGEHWLPSGSGEPRFLLWFDGLACILCSCQCCYVRRSVGFQSYLLCPEVGLQGSLQSSLSLNFLINKMELMMMVR